MSAALKFGRADAARVATNVVAFQAAWFACVASAARGAPLLAVASVAVAVALHFAMSSNRRVDTWLVVICLAAGTAFDTTAIRLGWIEYASPVPFAGFAPVWILALWALFATALREPLRWLQGRPALAAAFGAVGGPLSYAAAARMGACHFADSRTSLLALGIGWALMTPLLVEAARRLDARGWRP